jgi:L-arabinose isomerase
MIEYKIGFLPLYLKLYDDLFPEMREGMEAFSKTIQKELIKQGIKINPSSICRTKEEVENAGKLFADCSAVVCLHLAYSPSLESVDMLESLNKPLIMLDTTMGESFGTEATGEDLMNNHGIHGLQEK